MINILMISNKNSLLATAIFALISKDTDLNSVELVAGHDEASHRLRQSNFSLLIDFVDYPTSPLLSKVSRLVEHTTKLMLVISTTDKVPIFDLSRFQVDGLISIDATYEEFRAAIRIVAIKNLKYISPHLISGAASLFRSGDAFSTLSHKEFDVAHFLMRGKKNTDIAAELNISHKTVSTYKARIFKKLHIETDFQLYMYAQQNSAEL